VRRITFITSYATATSRHSPRDSTTLPLPPLQPEDHPAKRRWATFTYTGRETTFITKLFKHTDIRVAFRTNNNLLHNLTLRSHNQDIYTQSGVYRLTCPDCGKAYVGQTGRDFKTRFNEYKRSFRHSAQTSKFAQHLATHQHTFGNIQDTMEIQQHQKRGMHLNTVERFYIYKEASVNNHLNDEHTIPSSKIFETILKDFDRYIP
jgi:hypothetical protein